MNLNDRNVMVTGGSKGIGLAIAREFAAGGANVFLVARNEQTLSEAKEAIQVSFPDIKVGTDSCDVSDYESVCNAVDAMRGEFGEIHGLVNNAGYAKPEYFENIEPEEFRRTMEVDYLGSVFATKAVLPYLRPGAFIAFTSSVAGYVGAFGYTSYAPAKFAQIGFAESLEQELLSREIQVSVLCPPDTNTPGYATENETKPFETHEISKGAKLMQAEDVASRFVDKLQRGAFIINVNIESQAIYRLKGIAPKLARRILHGMVRAAQKKKGRTG
ncbi:MAG: SDR family oxidoreductase [Candidatus Hydrogenedentes bacterium]|nr:SDR family oxidoreductase [Candidatus Hydrogenedentota bacterium]